MAKKKRQENGIKLIHIIFMILIIAIVIFVSRNFIKNNEKIGKDQEEQGQEQIGKQEKNVKVFDDGVKLNTSDKLNGEKKFEELKIKDIQLTYRNGVTNLLCNIENNSKEKIKMQDVEITLLDEKGEIIYKMVGIIEDINSGETKQFNTSVTADFSNAYDFKITKK